MVIKKDINSKYWSTGAVPLLKIFYLKVYRKCILKELDFFNLVIDKKSKIVGCGCGCGFGYFQKFFYKKKYRNIIGIDPDKNLLKSVQKK